MLATERIMASSSSDELWKAFRPSPPASEQPAELAEPKDLEEPSARPANEFRRLMLQSQEFRALPSANANAAAKGTPKDIDKTTFDTVFACLAICADEERRAISFGSQEVATAMRRTMHTIKKKFGLK
jgi:hypothetical protein